VLRADGNALDGVTVLTNDVDPDGDRLTVSIEEQPPIGVATANPDGTVRIDSLPSGFKGVTWFKYRVTDPAGLSTTATAVVYVGTDAFRVLFAGDANSSGTPEVYLANFLAAPIAVTAATEGTLRLRGFIASENGSTVVYRRADTATPSITDLSFVRTATPSQQVRIALPSGTTLVQDAAGNDQYAVSPNGQWIAFIAGDSANIESLYVLNVDTPATVSKVTLPGAQYVASPRFSSNSQDLYVLASASTDGANRSLYVVGLNGGLSVSMVSAPNAVFSSDDVIEYAVAPDQSRVVMRANRGGREGLYFVDTSHLQSEVQVSHPFAVTEHLIDSTLRFPPGRGGSTSGQHVAYTTQDVVTGYRVYVADVSATPNPRLATTACTLGILVDCRGLGLSPDDGAVLYVKNGVEVHEAVLASGEDVLVSPGAAGWYDSTGNIVLIEQFRPSGGSPSSYPGLGVAVRGAFGSATPLGTGGLAASYFALSGIDHAVTILGEGATTGPAPATARLALVNEMAPDKLLNLADFESPLQLTSPMAQIVSN
jgi:hypothetical protein